MHKYIALFFSVSLFLSACKGGKPKVEVIKHDQMVNLLIDIHIIDGSVYNNLSSNPDTLYKYGTAKYLEIFKKHHVDSVEFRRSLKYYSDQPTEMAAMYTEILDRLREKTDSLNNKMLKRNNVVHPR